MLGSTYSFHHKTCLELEHVTAVGDLVETAIKFHLDRSSTGISTTGIRMTAFNT